MLFNTLIINYINYSQPHVKFTGSQRPFCEHVTVLAVRPSSYLNTLGELWHIYSTDELYMAADPLSVRWRALVSTRDECGVAMGSGHVTAKVQCKRAHMNIISIFLAVNN